MRKKFVTIALAIVIGGTLASIQALTQQQAPPALTMEKVKVMDYRGKKPNAKEH